MKKKKRRKKVDIVGGATIIFHSQYSCLSHSRFQTIFCLAVFTVIQTRCKYFDPCYARATVARARFLAAAFSDGSYLAHVNGAYLRHVTFCIVRGPTPFVHRVAYLWVAGRCSLNVPWNTCVPYFSRNEMSRLPWTPASPILAVM